MQHRTARRDRNRGRGRGGDALVRIATRCSVFSGVPSARSLTAVLSSTWWVGPATVTDCGLIVALMAPPWPCPSLQLPATAAVTQGVTVSFVQRADTEG